MNIKKVISFVFIIFLLFGLFFISINLGSIKVTYFELFHGLFIKYNEDVATIYDLRFPRIIIAMLSGASFICIRCAFSSGFKKSAC